jgi:Na+-transporting NADH:ubiquinone oxidoreductase subunit NqrC
MTPGMLVIVFILIIVMVVLLSSIVGLLKKINDRLKEFNRQKGKEDNGEEI